MILTTDFKIKYDTPIEVNQKQFIAIKKECDGFICHQEKDGRYFIKVWDMRTCTDVRKLLKAYQ